MKEAKVRIMQRKLIFQGYIDIEEAELCFNSEVLSAPCLSKRTAIIRKDAVAVVAYIPSEDRLVLVKQYRYPVQRHHEGWLLEIPAGMMEDCETPCQTMERELCEETGFKTSSLTFVQHFFISPGISMERVHLFYTELKPEDQVHAGGGVEQEQENIEVLCCSAREVLSWLDEGKILDAKTIIGLQWFFMKKRLDTIDV